MADLSKFQINGKEYDLKDPIARQNSGVGGNSVYYMDLAAEYPKPDSEIYFNSVTLSALSNNGAGIKIGDIIVASNGTLCKVTSVSDTTVGYDAIGTISGTGTDSGGNVNQGTGWTTAQIDLLDSLLSHINYTDTEGGVIADQLIASLRGESSGGETEPDEPDEPTADITQSGSVLTIVSGVTATQTSNVLAIA